MDQELFHIVICGIVGIASIIALVMLSVLIYQMSVLRYILDSIQEMLAYQILQGLHPSESSEDLPEFAKYKRMVNSNPPVGG